MHDLAELTACYSNTGRPRATERGVKPGQGFAEQLRYFAAGAREGVYRPDVATGLLAGSDQAYTELNSDADRVEYFWFLFSQKAWPEILRAARTFDGVGRLPLHIADLTWLAFYRSQTQRIMAGTERDEFLRDGEAFLQFVRNRWPAASDRHDIYAATIRHVAGETDGARQTFLETPPSEPLIEPLGGVETVRPPGSRGYVPTIADFHPAQTRHVALVSLDRDYFDKFASPFARKFSMSNGTDGLHFHCVGFDPSMTIREWGLSVPIGWTIDSTNLTGLGPRARRGYYAASRYIHLPKYLEHHESVFVADVDGLLTRDLGAMAQEHASDDIVLTSLVLDPSRRLYRLPWEAIAAGIFMARATDGGMAFAQAVRGYLLDVMERALSLGKPFWYADQAALYYCWHDLKDEIEASRFRKPAFKQVGSWKLFQGDEERIRFLEG